MQIFVIILFLNLFCLNPKISLEMKWLDKNQGEEINKQHIKKRNKKQKVGKRNKK